MSWWRNDDPYDDENEAEIKATAFVSLIIFIFIMMAVVAFMTSCSIRYNSAGYNAHHTEQVIGSKTDCIKK